MSKYDDLLKLAIEFEQTASDSKHENKIDLNSLPEKKIEELLLKAKVREDLKFFSLFGDGARTPEQKTRVEKIKKMIETKTPPKLEIKSEYGQFTCYIDEERVAGGKSKKEALLNAAAKYLV